MVVECTMVFNLIALLSVFLLVYWLLEVHYFLRTLFTYLHAKFAKKKLNVLNTSSYSSICLTTDIDILLFHMNNARFLREVDFARTDFYSRTRLWQTIRAKGGQVYQSGTTIRYRRFIKLFSVYRITSRIVYWDQNSIYMEHRFVSRNDSFVKAIVYGKQRVVKCNVDEVMTELMKSAAANSENTLAIYQKPDCPPEIAFWIESTIASSNKLRENSV